MADADAATLGVRPRNPRWIAGCGRVHGHHSGESVNPGVRQGRTLNLRFPPMFSLLGKQTSSSATHYEFRSRNEWGIMQNMKKSEHYVALKCCLSSTREYQSIYICLSPCIHGRFGLWRSSLANHLPIPGLLVQEMLVVRTSNVFKMLC